MSAGGLHSALLRPDGTVFCWGRNNEGQCNVPAGLSNVVQIDAGHVYTLALKKEGTVVHWGFAGYGMRPIPAVVTNIVQIAAGSSHCLALRGDGRVLAWGWNGWGQTNVPAGLSNVIGISAGDAVSAALRADGTVVAWGAREAVPPTGLNSVTQISCGSAHILALRRDGTVAAWGMSSASEATNVPVNLGEVIQVEAGLGFSLALKKDGSVIGWGHGEASAPAYYGQSTIPSELQKVRRISAGNFHVLAEQADPTPALLADSDADGLSDYEEVVTYKTDPANSDTDADGNPDGIELSMGLSPLLPEPAGLSTGLIAYYPFNADAADSSGHGHDGIAHNLTTTSNRFSTANSAWSFNGTNAYFSIPSSSELTLSTNFSVSLWIFQRDAQFEGYRLVDKAYAGETNGIILDTYGNFAEGSGRRLRLQTGTVPGVAINVVGNTVYSLFEWHNVVATVSGTTGRLYLDGRLDGSGNVGRISQNDLDIFIGADHPFKGSGNSHWFNGVIDDVRFYSRALMASEISELYNVEKSTPAEAPGFTMTSLAFGIFRSVLTPVLPGQRTILQRSTNLADWIPIETNTTATSMVTFTNSASSAAGPEFFRAVLE